MDPGKTSGLLSEERSARPPPRSMTYVLGEGKDGPGPQLFPYSTSEPEMVLGQEAGFRPGPEESRSSRRTKLEPVEPTATDRQ